MFYNSTHEIEKFFFLLGGGCGGGRDDVNAYFLSNYVNAIDLEIIIIFWRIDIYTYMQKMKTSIYVCLCLRSKHKSLVSHSSFIEISELEFPFFSHHHQSLFLFSPLCIDQSVQHFSLIIFKVQ